MLFGFITLVAPIQRFEYPVIAEFVFCIVFPNFLVFSSYSLRTFLKERDSAIYEALIEIEARKMFEKVCGRPYKDEDQ